MSEAQVEDFPADLRAHRPLNADSPGEELRNHLPDRHVATVLTQVVVDDRDPAFGAPTKFVGPVYDEAGASAAAAEHGWTVAPDGPHWRRVVPSPEPREIIEVRAVEALVSAGIITVCAGGGGIPVRRDSSDMLHGVEAVVDKDLTAALLATELGADALLLLTDVDAVYRAWGTDDASRLACVSPEGARQVAAPAGSMGPKLEAAARFVEAGGALAGIGALEDAGLILSGEAGTIVT